MIYFLFFDYQELPNQCGLDGKQIVKDLFSALAEGHGNMKQAVVLQPAALTYAESLLKFAFLLSKEVWPGLSRQNVMRVVNHIHSNHRAHISAIYISNQVKKKPTGILLLS